MELRPLLEILADGSFHSGEKLGFALGISRTAVWKQVEHLRRLGIEVHSVTGKGYRLPSSLDLLCRNTILSYLPNDAWRENFEVLFSTDSTNEQALRKAHAGAEGYIIFAEHQTHGRGRRGRTWISPPGTNIYMSQVALFQSGIGGLEGLSLVVALLVVRALEWCGFEGMGLKWPNDILLDGRKLAGILLEVSGDMSGPCKVVIGIGLNIRMPESTAAQIDQPFTDLASNFVKRADRNMIAAALMRELVGGLEEFVQHGFARFRADWEALDVYKGRIVELRAGSNVETGRVMGVDNSGALLLETPSGPKVMSGGELLPSLRPVVEGLSHDS